MTFLQPMQARDAPATADPDVLRLVADNPDVFSVMEPNSALPSSASSTSGNFATTGASIEASPFSFDGLRGLGSLLTYVTSKWALACIAMAIILNRTHVFAATRRRLRLRWPIRVLLRLPPILLTIIQISRLLRSIQCQTSPNFSQLRWGEIKRSSHLVLSHNISWLNTLASSILFGASDEQSCLAVNMIPLPGPKRSQLLHGSLSLLWPLFGVFCLSTFLETVSCVLQGRPFTPETGMTLFEQSLAFAEADATVSHQLGWAAFANFSDSLSDRRSDIENVAVTRSTVLARANTAPEVLLVALLSCMGHLTSHILGVLDLQARYRLVITGFWGFCFMASIAWCALTFEQGNPSTYGLLRMPTVCLIGFIPHILVLAGIATCLLIYGLALLFSAFMDQNDINLPRMSIPRRIAYAHRNMQVHVSLSDLRITREMDFYTALLRTGLAAITMASEAVYLNEDRGISLPRHTWLEEARIREIEGIQRQRMAMRLPIPSRDQVGTVGLIPVQEGSVSTSNGFRRERAAQNLPKLGYRRLRSGVGASERCSRCMLALEFLGIIAKLVTRVCAMSALWVLRTSRIVTPPAWLFRLVHRSQKNGHCDARGRGHTLDEGRLPASKSDNELDAAAEGIDVEKEFRRVGGAKDEETLDHDLYRYWLKGGWWGSNDSSGEFVPKSTWDRWDETSVVSADDDPDFEYEETEQKTSTVISPRSLSDDETIIDNPLNVSDLAQLLQPSSRHERKEAMRLAAHLQSDKIITRAGFRRLEKLRQIRVFAPAPQHVNDDHSRSIGHFESLDFEEEEHLLEQIILSHRQTVHVTGEELHPGDHNDVSESSLVFPMRDTLSRFEEP
ncbi:hypothetical protein CDD83_3103 [Cordyceps sp. RAO-2017]|nr:hypothetical protein CDD83_3103 [Cordyceps sp. RAO-2017]